MGRWHFKADHNYYRYKGRKRKIQRTILILLVMLVVVVGAILTGNLTRETFRDLFNRQSHKQYDDELPTYFYQDEIAYDLYRQPVKVKGLYLPSHKIDKLDELIEVCNETVVNSLVIDVKNDYGYLTFSSDNELLNELGVVSKTPNISDIEEVMNKLYNNNIYPIARIVVFKDQLMSTSQPDRMVKDKDGNVYTNQSGETWLNPYDKRNWEYILEVCKEAIRVGFKEIQFDYIRFHESMNSETVDLPVEPSKTEIITEFVQYMEKELEPYGVFVSADVFGAIITSKTDGEIVGQDYEELIKHLDYISPMVYPSHYAPGSFGVQYPDLEPYQIILKSMEASNKIVKGIPRNERKAIVRPWLQDFTATWINPHQVYGKEQVEEQIRATYDGLLDEWILWNAAANYTIEALH